jgi:hypothetical protein
MAMRESPTVASSYIDAASMIKFVSKKDFEIYKRDGIVVIDDVLTEDELALARSEINGARSLGNNTLQKKNTDGGSNRISFVVNNQNDLSVRSDLVCWVSESIGIGQISSIGPGLLKVVRYIRCIPKELEDFKEDGELLGVPFSSQLACYNGGKSHYVAHRDSPIQELPEMDRDPRLIDSGNNIARSAHVEPSFLLNMKGLYFDFKSFLSKILHGDMDARKITIIIYLNDKIWDSNVGGLSDSGHLRIYNDAHMDDDTGKTCRNVLDITPIGGRMVIFDSRRILHEVRPSHQRRLALTCWVGGSHSSHEWLRPFCLPLDEINFSYYYDQFCDVILIR